MDTELLFVAGGGVKGKHRLAALLVVRAGFLAFSFWRGVRKPVSLRKCDVRKLGVSLR